MKLRMRVLCLLVAFVFLTLSFSGCGGENTSNNGTGTEASTSTAAVSTTVQEKEKTLEDYTDEMKLTAYQGANYGGPTIPSKDTEYAKYVKEKFKINVDEFVWPAGEDVAQKISTFAASGEMPDIIQAPLDAKNKDVFKQMADSGMLLDVEEYLNKYAPEAMKYFTPTILDVQRNPTDNKLYIIPGYTVNPALKDKLTVDTNEVLIYREDLLKKAGLEVPKTPDEFYNVLKTFKQMDAPNGNKIVPFCPLWNGAPISNVFGIIGAMFGTQKYHAKTNDAEQRLIDVHESPEYLDYLKFTSKLFREGLIHTESYTLGWQKVFNEFLPQGLIGVSVMWPSTISGLTTLLQKVVPEGNYMPMPLPKADGVGDSEYWPVITLGSSAIVISKKVSDPERLFKYLNWMSTNEGWATMVWGPPSKDNGNWFIDDSGKLIDNKELADQKMVDPKWYPSLGGWAYGLVGILQYTQDLVLDQAREKEPIRQLAKTMSDSDIFMDTIYDIYSMSPDGPVGQVKKTDITKIFTEQEAKIIMDSKSDQQVEDSYKQMMEAANKAGLIEVLKEDYQRYQEIKTKYSK